MKNKQVMEHIYSLNENYFLVSSIDLYMISAIMDTKYCAIHLEDKC